MAALPVQDDDVAALPVQDDDVAALPVQDDDVVALPVTLPVKFPVIVPEAEMVVAAIVLAVVAPIGCGEANNCVMVDLRSAVSAALCSRIVSAATGTAFAVWSVMAPGNRIAEST